MSVAFLFGAGASAFSGQCFPANPPLGNALFDELVKQGGVAATVTPDLAMLFRVDFEAGMAEFRRQHEVETTTFLREMALYLSRFAPGDKNLFTLLVKTLTSPPRPAVLATLNYDLLIELAISKNGKLVAYQGPPTPYNNISVLKLHGSCNFLPNLGSSSIRGIGFDLSQSPGSAILEYGVRAVDVPEIRKFCREEDALAPAMALYARGKTVLIAPAFVKQQQQDWSRVARTASQVFVVGVKVNEEDLHVWDPLQRGTGSLFYVGPDADPFLNWASKWKRRDAYHLADSFELAMNEINRRVLRR